jgi:hypothetical protein
MTTLYIAGPMSGHPDYNRQAFQDAERLLKSVGFEVLNPARQPDGLPYETYIERGYDDIDTADGVALLPGWHASSGARREVAYADANSKDASELGIWLIVGARSRMNDATE